MAEHVNRTFTCQDCNFVFKKRSHLLRHQLVHTNERPHVCDICQKAFRTPFHLNRHLATHSGIKSFKCDYEGCEVACITEWNLKRHIKRTHFGKFKCAKCDKEFKKNKLLQQHLSSEHKNSIICCEFPGCPLIFSVPAKMRHHMKIHTERRYLCPVKDCHLKFSLWSECRLHTVQCKKKEISCDVCGKMFTERSNLKAHRKIHSEEREVFLCTYDGCGRFYTKQYNLKAHVQSFHMNIRPFVCPKSGCNKSFHFQHLLRNHLENIHNKIHVPNEKKERKKRTRRLQMSTVAAITGYIPQLWDRMTPEEIKCYVDDDKSLSGNDESPNDTTQAEMPPVMDDKPDVGHTDVKEEEETGVIGSSHSSSEFETITELVEITPSIYKPVQRVVRRPHLNKLKPSYTITSSSSSCIIDSKLNTERKEEMISIPTIATRISTDTITEQNEGMVVESEDLSSKINIEQEECMKAFSNRFKHMLGKHCSPAPPQNIHGSCGLQSMTESDSSDNDAQNKQVQCIV